MSQQCVHLHTKKELNATEDILKNEGMEIIVQSNDATLPFSDLTEEEKKSYMLEVEKDLKEQFKLNEKALKKFGMLMKDYSSLKNAIESLNLMKNSDDVLRTIKAYDEYSQKMYGLSHSLLFSSDRMQDISESVGLNLRASRRTPNSQVSIRSIRCSLLIAKKGDNIIRYLSFKSDPILTITGSKANSLKSSLEKKF